VAYPEKVVLVVEDDEASREALLGLIEEVIGGQAIGAEDGVIAHQRVRDHPPDLIFLDLRLPRLDGWQVLRALKGNPATAAIPVVVVTTASFPRDREQALQDGADAFLAKPFDLVDLEALIQRFLG
jgi:CheY-like chemotaxis protein